MGKQTISSTDLCIGPNDSGNVDQQSLLMINLFIATDDYREESEPANLKTIFFIWTSLHDS